jgi:hypothetical protein
MVIKYPDCKDEHSFESGLEFQDFVLDTLINHLGLTVSYYSSRKWQFDKGESRQGVEIRAFCRRVGL